MSASRGLTFSKTNYLQPAFHDSNDIKFVYVFKTKFLKSEFRKTIKFTLKIKLNSKNFIIYRLQSKLMTFSVVTQTQTKHFKISNSYEATPTPLQQVENWIKEACLLR